MTAIPKFILNILYGDYSDSLTTEVAFSEWFGKKLNLDDAIKHGLLPNRPNIEEKYKKINYPRKAVYKKGYKLVVNGSNGNIVEFNYKGKAVDPPSDILKDMLEELEIFKGTENFVLP